MGEKDRYIAVPIPTYEEATSSRPTSSASYRGPQEISDDAEREGLLQNEDTSHYQPPRVESTRSSVDLLDSDDGRASAEELRREVEQMEIESPIPPRQSMSHLLSKRITSFTQSLSSLHLPFTRYLPSFDTDRLKAIFFSSDGNGFMIIGRLFGIFLIVSVVYLLIASDVISFGNKAGLNQIYDPESIRIYVQKHMNEDGNIQKYLERLTLSPHIAGSEGNYILAEWMQELFRESLEEVEMERFDVYLNYPRQDGRSVAIIDPPDKRWEAELEENPAYPDRQQSLVFHGYSMSGNATGPLIYANYGSQQDFKFLKDNGIDVNGSIALVRYGGTQGDRSLKVRAAELAGAVGCIIYSDPADDGFVVGPAWPKGQTMPEDGVQRGSVGLTALVAGDILSPGWASTPDEKHRLELGEANGINKIPSIPMSWGDAQHLLQSLKGHGKQLSDKWVGGVPNIDWWSGDQSSPIVRLTNVQDEEIYQPIYNVLGSLAGWEQPDKKIIVGNHRDSWCFGAVDPGSGTAIMLEVMRIIGEIHLLGWRPLRTIEFASWDAEEYNLIGSTEYVEQRSKELRLNGYAYVNIDVGVSGPNFWASGSPVFQSSLLRVLERVPDPQSNRTLREIWDEQGTQLGGLGAGSDYVAFQEFVGMSSLDFGFNGSVPYPYHSCYENFEWMKTVGDPGFVYHKAMAEIFVLMILELADRPVLPFDLQSYAAALSTYVADLETWTKEHVPEGEALDFTPLRTDVDHFQDEAAVFEEWERQWTEVVYGSNGFESNVLGIRRIDHNNRMANFESHLLDMEEDGGLINRTQFKHVIFAPDPWSGYDVEIFPSIRDAVSVGNWSLARAQLAKVDRIVSHAIHKLNHN